MLVPLQGAAAALRLLLEVAVWFGSVLAARLPLPGALPGPVERFGAGMLSAACACLCQMWCPCVGAGRLVPLQVVAAGCRCRVLLEGAARPLQAEWRVRFGAGMLVPQRSLQGPAAVCRCRVLQGCCLRALCALGAGMLVLLHGAGAGAATGCRAGYTLWRLERAGPLQGAA